MTRLLLARHAQSEWNAEGRWQGQADPPLSELGRRQAEVAAGRLASLAAIEAVAASDLDRAAETAAIIAGRLGLAPPTLHADLRERDAGEFSGLTRDEIEQRWPGWLEQRRRPPSWETDDLLLVRTRRALDTIASSHPGAVVLVVTHGGVVYTLETAHGLEHQRLANLEGRWATVGADGMELGSRELLVDPHDAAVSVPRAL